MMEAIGNDIIDFVQKNMRVVEQKPTQATQKRDRWALYADKRNREFSKQIERPDHAVKCAYCRDKGVLFMNPEWVAMREIPAYDAVETHQTSQAGGMRDQIAVVCDCQGEVGEEDGNKQSRTRIGTYSRIFGHAIGQSMYGHRLKAHWKSIASQNEPEPEPF